MVLVVMGLFILVSADDHHLTDRPRIRRINLCSLTEPDLIELRDRQRNSSAVAV